MEKPSDKMTIDQLLTEAERIARKKHDGHLTILSFTTHWKAFFGTPNLDDGAGRTQVWKAAAFKTLRDALVFLVADEPVVDYEETRLMDLD